MFSDQKPIEEQVIVITGATSGIGLTTACLAADKGAKVVLAARNEEALKDAVDEIRESGGEACFCVADVSDFNAVGRISKKAIDEYGGFDTWVNNAGIIIFGKCDDISLEDHHRLFETNYWGVVHGSLIAIEHFRKHGGTLINVGSVDSDRAIPLQGPYSATKHAVKAFTDALRMELEYDDAPVSVSLIKPASTNTPLKDHAKSYLGEAPELPPPVYDPILVAKAIVHCAEVAKRDMIIGGGGRLMSTLGMHRRMADRYQEATQFSQQHSGHSAAAFDRNNIYHHIEDGEMRGTHEGRVHNSSPYTWMERRPAATATSAAGVMLGVLAATGLGYWLSRQSSEHRRGVRRTLPDWVRFASSESDDEGTSGWTPYDAPRSDEYYPQAATSPYEATRRPDFAGSSGRGIDDAIREGAVRR